MNAYILELQILHVLIQNLRHNLNEHPYSRMDQDAGHEKTRHPEWVTGRVAGTKGRNDATSYTRTA
jgi:hypothetical protein